jgi:2'-5' RNA ligase
MIKPSERSRWGCVALVSYVPSPLGAVLDRLRHPPVGAENPRAHVTLLPPRPLQAPIEVASLAIQETLRSFSAFQVQFSGIRCFPETNVIYLDIGEGKSALHTLHDSLNTGVLADSEAFEFLPHLTLSSSLPTEVSEEVRQDIEAAWTQVMVPRSYWLEETVLLWISPANEGGSWQQLWNLRLGATAAAASASHSSITLGT